MIKQLAVIFLLTAFTVQTFNRAIVVFNYYSNTASFAKNCENKARPMLHCNGRCQMMKKLKQEENNDKQNPERRNENKNEVLYFSKNNFSIRQNTTLVTITYRRFNNNNTKEISSDFFQPPRA